MKYCLSISNPSRLQAEEIRVPINQLSLLDEEILETKRVIVEVPKGKVKELNNFYLKNTTLALESLSDLEDIPEGTKFFYQLAISSYSDYFALLDLGVSDIRIDSPLSFDVDFLKKTKGETIIRFTPNIAYRAYIPRKNGLLGSYIRPEEVEFYEEGIDVFEFENIKEISQEKTLFEVYKRGSWNGNLNLLITNLNIDVDNRLLPQDLLKKRSNCRLSCLGNSSHCNVCKTAFQFANALTNSKPVALTNMSP